jgi:hypothetical protein
MKMNLLPSSNQDSQKIFQTSSHVPYWYLDTHAVVNVIGKIYFPLELLLSFG